MLDLKVGLKEIFSENPKKFYFLTGPEYGVKAQYLSNIESKFKGREEFDNFNDLINSFKTKSLIPREPKLYVIRYDLDFLKGLNADSAKRLSDAKIVGIVIGLYQEDNHESKLDKYFPDNVLRVNSLAPQILKKHLLKEFIHIPEMYIDLVVNISSDYYEAMHMCQRMNLLSMSELSSIPTSDIKFLFTCGEHYNNDRFKEAIASRSYIVATEEIESYEGELSLLFYDILNTFLEIIKVLEKPYTDSPVKKYVEAKLWDIQSAKAMFNVSYEQLEKTRNISNYPPYIALNYICSLLQFNLG